MKNYRKVQAIINKKFPDLMKLKDGVQFRFNTSFKIQGEKIESNFLNKDFTLIYHNIRSDSQFQTSDFRQTVIVIKSVITGVVGITVGLEVSMDYFVKNFEILGQPITVQSLERYLSLDEYIKMTISNGILEIERLPNNDIYIELDLSKPPESWGEKKWGEILTLLTK